MQTSTKASMSMQSPNASVSTLLTSQNAYIINQQLRQTF